MTDVPTESTAHPLAVQLAKLLVRSDVDELREVVRRWTKEAPMGTSRKQYEIFGAKVIELKQAFAEAPVPPTEQELELALTMMLNLAASSAQQP